MQHAKFLADGVELRMGGASATLPAHRAVLFLMAWGGEGRGCEHIIALETSKPKSNIYIYQRQSWRWCDWYVNF